MERSRRVSSEPVSMSVSPSLTVDSVTVIKHDAPFCHQYSFYERAFARSQTPRSSEEPVGVWAPKPGEDWGPTEHASLSSP